MKKLSVFLVLILFISGCSVAPKKTTQEELDRAVSEYKQLVEDNNTLQSIISEKLGSDLSLIEKCETLSQELKQIGERFYDTEKLAVYSYISAINLQTEDARNEYESLKEYTQNKIKEIDLYQRAE